MRVAVTKGTLRVPPTYFAVQHALALGHEHEFRFFTAASDVTDADVAARIDLFDASRTIPLVSRLDAGRRDRLAPLFGRRQAAAIEAWHPDLVHQHFANLSAPAVRASRRIPAPLVLTVHGGDAFIPLLMPRTLSRQARMLLPRHRRTVAHAYLAADRILAVSSYLADVAIRGGAPAAKVSVHYQGVDVDAYGPGASAPEDAPPRIVAVSSLSEPKGTRDLVEASVALLPRMPHQLVLVGDGPLRAFVADAARRHPHIFPRGALDRDGVRRELSSATVFALPTKRNGIRREAAGLALLEAQASGVPVVVYDSGGAREMLKDGETGLLIDEGDVTALTESLGAVIALPRADRLAMGQRARAWVVENRSLAKSAQELDGHYREVS